MRQEQSKKLNKIKRICFQILFFSNNIIGGDNLNYYKDKLFLFWNIGKIAYEKEKDYENIIEKLANFCSYRFGDSFFHNRENINLMKLFYLSFPIYYKDLEKITWDQYQLLFQIKDKKERFFYFTLSLLFDSDYSETLDFIQNDYYLRI